MWSGILKSVLVSDQPGKLRNMIRGFLFGIVGISIFAIAATAQAQELKIGFVNAAQVLEQSPQAESARRKLEQEFSPRDKLLVEEQKQLRAMEEKITRDAAIMSEGERRKLERDILSRKRDIKRTQEEFREDLNIRRNETFDRLRRRVFEVIVDIAKSEKYDLIVSDGVVFSSEQVDMTSKVVARLKQEFEKASGNQ